MLLTGKERVTISGVMSEKGSFYTRHMVASKLNVVSAVSREASAKDAFPNLPIFMSVKEAVERTQPDILIIYDAPKNVKDRVIDALMAGVPWIIIGTDHVPLLDMAIIRQKLSLSKSILLGPSSSGVLIPGRGAFGSVTTLNYEKRSGLGVVSRSESLLLMLLDVFPVGFSQIIDIGSDPIVGMDINSAVDYLMKDPETKQVLIMSVKDIDLRDIPYPKPMFYMVVGEDKNSEFKHVEKVTSLTYLKKLGRKERTHEKRNTKSH